MESEYQYPDQIIPFLIKLAKSLPKAIWLEDIKRSEKEQIARAETFTFFLNTMMSDIAMFCPDYSEEIIQTQIDILSNLANIIKSGKNASITPSMICKNIMPVLLGLCRSMGRYSLTDSPLLCQFFPRSNDLRRFNTYSGEKNYSYLKPKKNINTYAFTFSPNHIYKKEHVKENEVYSINIHEKLAKQFEFITYCNSTNLFIRDYGSSSAVMFQFASQHSLKQVKFSAQNLQTIFNIAKKLLTRETLDYLDHQAREASKSEKYIIGEYQSFSEITNLVVVTLLREILQDQNNLSAPFTKDIQEFVKCLFLIGQTELQGKTYEYADKEVSKLETEMINKYKINILANAACVDLLVWTISDEIGNKTYIQEYFSSIFH